ncbi:transposase [Leisingera caerulea]|nr:transposase [Leisingera caerulea]UWQ61998.1 transposase [Leisingera caerulea]
MLRYKLEETGGILVKVPAAYTSQTCAACGHVDARGRDSQALFA